MKKRNKGRFLWILLVFAAVLGLSGNILAAILAAVATALIHEAIGNNIKARHKGGPKG